MATAPLQPEAGDASASWKCATLTAARQSVIRAPLRNQAGLNDRLFVLHALGNVAASVSARLVVNRPCDALSMYHNANRALNCNYSWSRYTNFTFIGDKTDVLVSSTKPLDLVGSLRDSPRFRYIGQGGMARERPGPIGAAPILRQFCRARASQVPFVWSLDNPGDAVLALRAAADKLASCPTGGMQPREPPNLFRTPPAHGPHACSYVTQAYSAETLALRDELLRAFNLKGRPYLTLHLRRRDLSARCPSPVERVLAYLNCSGPAGLHGPPSPRDHSPGTTRHHGKGWPLLLFTDESDPNYLQALLRGIKRLRAHGSPRFAPVFHADPRFSEVAAGIGLDVREDNFLIYRAGQAVQDGSAFQLQLRHNHCLICQNVSRADRFAPYRRVRAR